MKLNNLLIAHRGIHNNIDIPENSLKAFNLAIKNKVDIEFDIQITKDNVLVIFHDDNLRRLTNLDKEIKDLTYNELNKLKLLNTNEKIPTLKEVLNLVNGKVLLDIEIKNTKKIKLVCDKLINELNNYKGNFVIKSFNPKIIRYIKKIKSKYITGLLIKQKYYNNILGKIITKYSKCNFLAISKKFINKYGIKSYFKKYNILIWTIKNNEEMNKYKNVTNNYICNNIPFD